MREPCPPAIVLGGAVGDCLDGYNGYTIVMSLPPKVVIWGPPDYGYIIIYPLITQTPTNSIIKTYQNYGCL